MQYVAGGTGSSPGRGPCGASLSLRRVDVAILYSRSIPIACANAVVVTYSAVSLAISA